MVASDSGPSRPTEPLLRSSSVRRATVLLIALRIGYAYNWFDIGPTLPALGATFSVGPAAWGVVVAVFLIGAGVAQVPAGLLAQRWGFRTTSLAGVGVLGVAGLAAGAAPTFDALVGLRVVAGVGAGLFFSPAIGLVGSLYPTGQRGVPVGTFSSAFSAGSGLGVFVSALVLPVIGWRATLGVGGAGLSLLALAALIAIPKEAGAPPARATRRISLEPLRARALWAIGVAFMGLEGAEFATGQFVVPYGQIVRGWSPALAGTIGALFVFPSVFGGPAGGRFAERFTNRRTQLVVATLIAAVFLALLPVEGTAAVALIGVVFSMVYGFVYGVMYVLAYYLPSLRAEEIPLAIAIFNGVQLGGGAAVSFFFAQVVQGVGYSGAWMFLAAMMVVFLAALLFVPRTGARAAAEDHLPVVAAVVRPAGLAP